MDKETMEKINEVLKANGRRELNADELDMVNGGESEYICDVNGVGYTKEFVADLANNITKQFGYTIAAGVICEKFGLSTTEISTTTDQSDLQKMGVLLTTLFRVSDRDHTY